MDVNKPIKKRKSFVPKATRFFLVLSSIAGTVGIWNLISSQELAEASTNDLTLPPIPTIVPLIDDSQQSEGISQSAVQPLPTLRAVTPMPQTGYSSPMNSAPVTIPGPITSSGPSR